MERFYVYTPEAKGTGKVDRIERFAELIPVGKKNAIKRSDLVDKCIEIGLISADAKRMNQDRSMRKLIERTRMDYNMSITNDGDGCGYYRPTKEDLDNLRSNNKREDKRAISTFASMKINKAYEEDLKVGRL